MGRAYTVYMITSPSGRNYIGVTARGAERRWKDHMHVAARGDPRPLYAAIRKYGAENFTVSTVEVYPDQQAALEAETQLIQMLDDLYNISPGGSEDIHFATRVHAERMAEDPEYRARYLEALKEGIRQSTKHNSKELSAMRAELLKEWQRANPYRAYCIQRRATRIAAKKNTVNGVNEAKRRSKPPNKMQASRRRKKATAAVWASRSPEEKKVIAEKIADTITEIHASKTDAEREAHSRQLSEARKHINHDVRKARQKEALAAYWTPERRAAHSERMRERHANLRHHKRGTEK